MSADAREFELIRQLFVRQIAARSDVVLGIGDDAAITRVPPDHELLTATDSLVAGTHFLDEDDPASVGHRCLAINLSDLAAMGATPLWASLAIHMPEADEDWLKTFADGFFSLADRFGVQLIGGDTVRGPLALTVTVQGIVPTGQAVRRAGASAGDLLYLTGYPGSAAFGRLHQDSELASCFFFPEPRLSIGQELRGLASAMIDISDGVDSDLGHLLHASQVGATLDIEDLPVIHAAHAKLGGESVSELVLFGGEDYELCFSVPPAREPGLIQRAESWTVPLTRLGVINDMPALQWRKGGKIFSVPDKTFEHFSDS